MGTRLQCVGDQVFKDDQDQIGDVVVDGPKDRGLTLDTDPLLGCDPMEATTEMVEDLRRRKFIAWQV